jgi:sec-independent protein translocase protein TatA
MFQSLRGWEWLIIVALVLLLFGAKRLPDAARGLGRSLRIFKSETKGLVNEGGDSAATAAGATSTHTAQPEAIAPVAQAADVSQPAAERTEK